MSATAPLPGTILIADDNRMNRLLLARGLEQQGHSVAFAEHGGEALYLLRHQHFDLMLLDVLMPELDGYQVLGELKLDLHLRDIPVIVTSSLDSSTALSSASRWAQRTTWPSRSTPSCLTHGSPRAWRRSAFAISSVS